jgi:histidinol-phosphatase (PHP family)
MWANFHTHSTYCDGKTGLKEILSEAQTAGLLSLGFSSHAPVPFEKGWAMKSENFSPYLAEIGELKNIGSTVEVYAGLEVDFVPGKVTPLDFKDRLDYTIGSVHFVDYFDDGAPWEIDNTNLVFMDGLVKIFHGNARQAISRYFELTREMVRDYTPGVVGHLDKIKIQNIDNKLFREDDKWYRDEVERTLDVIKNSGSIVEINTRGIYQKKSETTYPSPWIVDLLFKKNIPVTISSDAHHPRDLTNHFDSAAAILSNAGYKTIQILNEGNWRPYRFNAHGLIA